MTQGSLRGTVRIVGSIDNFGGVSGRPIPGSRVGRSTDRAGDAGHSYPIRSRDAIRRRIGRPLEEMGSPHNPPGPRPLTSRLRPKSFPVDDEPAHPGAEQMGIDLPQVAAGGALDPIRASDRGFLDLRGDGGAKGEQRRRGCRIWAGGLRVSDDAGGTGAANLRGNA
jgi:hypothetical protein